MTPLQIITDIEKGDVLVDLRFASDAASLMRRMENHPVLNEALSIIKTQPSFRSACLARACALVEMRYPAGYAHPKRTAIAAYIYLLFSVPFMEGKRFIRFLDAMDRHDLLETNTIAHKYAKMISSLSIQYPSWTAKPANHELLIQRSSAKPQRTATEKNASMYRMQTQYAKAV